MRVTQAVRQPVHGLVAIILLLTLTACFGGGGGGGDGGGSSGTDGETIISLPSGGQVVIPKDALPSGADVSVESTPSPVLPDDVTAVGEAFSITATADLIKPATLRLPIPAGVTDPSNLVVVRVESDGTTTFLMSEVEGEELVTFTPGFSTFQSALLDSLSEQVIIVARRLPRIQGAAGHHIVVNTGLFCRPLKFGTALPFISAVIDAKTAFERRCLGDRTIIGIRWR